MQFMAEVKSGGFKSKMVKKGPPVVMREIKLLVDSNAYCLDEISKMVNQAVKVELSKIQVSFEDKPAETQYEPQQRTMLPPKTSKRVRRKSVLKD